MRAAILAAALLLVPAGAAAQARARCDAIPRGPGTSLLTVELPSGNRNTFMGGGVTFRCPGRGITLVADSLESYGDERRVFMLGNVSYREPRLRVTSDYLTYFQNDERVVAAGNVVATLPSGSTLRGPQAEYRRAVAGIRNTAELYSFGRPTVTIVRAESDARPPRAASRDTAAGPTTVTANVLFMTGDSLLYASGQVDIARPDFGATGDSVFMNTGTQYMRIMREPAITGKTGRPFRLTGDLIDLYSLQKQLDRVVSRGNANAVSDGLTLASDTIQFRIAQDLLQAAEAWGKTKQAEAVSGTQRITADSIAVLMPQQRVRRMSALGKAYAEASPDTTAFTTDDKDWLRGDTIIATFDTTRAVPPDTGQARIRQLLALGDAASYQHLPPQDTSLSCPAINYVRGDSILVSFDSGQVKTVRVISDTRARGGVYAEPDSTCGGRAAADTANVPPPGTVSPSAGTPAPGLPPVDPNTTVPAALPATRPQPFRQ